MPHAIGLLAGHDADPGEALDPDRVLGQKLLVHRRCLRREVLDKLPDLIQPAPVRRIAAQAARGQIQLVIMRTPDINSLRSRIWSRSCHV